MECFRLYRCYAEILCGYLLSLVISKVSFKCVVLDVNVELDNLLPKVASRLCCTCSWIYNFIYPQNLLKVTLLNYNSPMKFFYLLIIQ